MKITIELTEKEVMELKDLIFGEEKREVEDDRYSTVFDNRFALDKFVDSMMEIAKWYDEFTVADFKDMVGEEEVNYMDSKIGWTYKQIKDGKKVNYVQNGYELTMPKHYPLDVLSKR